MNKQLPPLKYKLGDKLYRLSVWLEKNGEKIELKSEIRSTPCDMIEITKEGIFYKFGKLGRFTNYSDLYNFKRFKLYLTQEEAEGKIEFEKSEIIRSMISDKEDIIESIKDGREQTEQKFFEEEKVAREELEVLERVLKDIIL